MFVYFLFCLGFKLSQWFWGTLRQSNMAMVKVNPPFIHRWISNSKRYSNGFHDISQCHVGIPRQIQWGCFIPFKDPLPSWPGTSVACWRAWPHCDTAASTTSWKQVHIMEPSMLGSTIAKSNKQRKLNKCTPMHHLEMVLSLRLANGHLLIPFYQDLYKCLQIFYAPGPIASKNWTCCHSRVMGFTAKPSS